MEGERMPNCSEDALVEQPFMVQIVAMECETVYPARFDLLRDCALTSGKR